MTPEIIIPVYEGQAFAIISCVLADGTIIDHNVELKSYKRLAKLTAASERHRIRVKEKRDKTPKVPKIPKVKPAKVEKPAIVRLTPTETELIQTTDSDSGSDSDFDETAANLTPAQLKLKERLERKLLS
jgi:hypothetical protein